MNTRPSRRFLPSDVGIARSQGQPTGKKLGHIDYSTSLTILLAMRTEKKIQQLQRVACQ